MPKVYADNLGQGGGVTSVAGKTGAVTLAESDVSGLVADLAAKANDANVLHTTGDESATGIKAFDDGILINGSQSVGASFYYTASAPTLTANINSTVTSIPVSGDIATYILGSAVVYPFCVQIDSELIAVLSSTSTTLTVRRGLGGTTRTSHSSGANVAPCFGAAEMLSARCTPMRTFANVSGSGIRVFLPPKSNIVTGLWTKPQPGQVFKLGFVFALAGQYADIESVLSATSSLPLVRIYGWENPDSGAVTAGCEVVWDDTAIAWQITGIYGSLTP